MLGLAKKDAKIRGTVGLADVGGRRKEKKGEGKKKRNGETYEFLLIIANPATTVDAELNLYIHHQKEIIVSENDIRTREKWFILEDKDSFQASAERSKSVNLNRIILPRQFTHPWKTDRTNQGEGERKGADQGGREKSNGVASGEVALTYPSSPSILSAGGTAR